MNNIFFNAGFLKRNSRPRAAEVIIDGDTAHLVRERERNEHLFASERLLP